MRARDRLNALKVLPVAVLVGYLLVDALDGDRPYDAPTRATAPARHRPAVGERRALQPAPELELELEDMRAPAKPAPPSLDVQPHDAPSSLRPEHATGPGRRRWVQLSLLRARLHPGLCTTQDEGGEAQDRLRARFRGLAWGDPTRLFVDDRLPSSLDPPLLSALESAERDVGAALALLPPRPDVFAYLDRDLLRASSCAADGASAFYDGSLHVLVTRRGLPQRLQRQYARHALVSRGLVGPSWAREGVAVLVARETWWREPDWLDRIANAPVDLEAMERDWPEALPEREASLLYARSAAMCSCAMRAAEGGVLQLLDALDVTQSRGELSYWLPPSAEPSHLQACVADLSRFAQ
jgi:hypothetical protein